MINKIMILQYVPALLWSAFIFVLCFIPGNDLPRHPWLEKIYFDKFVHAGLYFIFFILLLRGFKKQGRGRMVLPFLICLGQGILIECLQGSALIQGRSFDIWDIAANIFGVLIAVLLISRRQNSLS
jgi:VanZ family protein